MAVVSLMWIHYDQQLAAVEKTTCTCHLVLKSSPKFVKKPLDRMDTHYVDKIKESQTEIVPNNTDMRQICD